MKKIRSKSLASCKKEKGNLIVKFSHGAKYRFMEAGPLMETLLNAKNPDKYFRETISRHKFDMVVPKNKKTTK